MPNEATTCEGTNWCKRGDCVRCNDGELAWSPAWLAGQLARTDLVLTRVKNEDDCCAGQICMHYQHNAIRKVRGHGAPRPKGVAVSLTDALLVLRGHAAAK